MFFNRTKPQPNAGPPPSYAPIARHEYAQLMKELRAMNKRIVRTETRVTRLLEHQGLDPHGKPIVTS